MAEKGAGARQRCERRQGRRQFRPAGAGVRPPLLWTFPGAGNTWVRLLLDFATGIYTGSIYADSSLLPLLPGEGVCDGRALAVKAHPTHIDFHDLVPTADGAMRLNVTRKPDYLKCASLRFDALVFLVRDPYASIWAEYKRSLAYSEAVGGGSARSTACRSALRAQPLHSGGIPLACFNATHFGGRARRMAKGWRHMWVHYRKVVALGVRTHQVGYEELADVTRREGALARLVDFVLHSGGGGSGGGSGGVGDGGAAGSATGGGVATASHASAAQTNGSAALRRSLAAERIVCAFTLADDPRVHRARRREAAAGGAVTSASSAYGSDGLVCEMWKVFGAKARAAGYVPHGDVQCAQPPAGKASLHRRQERRTERQERRAGKAGKS